jgi:hypothetical protein
MNSRSSGTRGAIGRTENGLVRQDAGRRRLNIWIGGTNYTLCPDDSIGANPSTILVEIWRDEGNVLRCWINGVDVGSNPSSSNTLTLTGFGGTGGSPSWDDYMFEFLVGAGMPSAGQRAATRSYFNSKWGLY